MKNFILALASFIVTVIIFSQVAIAQNTSSNMDSNGDQIDRMAAQGTDPNGDIGHTGDGGKTTAEGHDDTKDCKACKAAMVTKPRMQDHTATPETVSGGTGDTSDQGDGSGASGNH